MWTAASAHTETVNPLGVYLRSERFGKDVGYVFASWDVEYEYDLLCDAISDKMNANVDVLHC